MNFDANMAVPVGVQVAENITWDNEMGGCQIPPFDGPYLGGGIQCLNATSTREQSEWEGEYFFCFFLHAFRKLAYTVGCSFSPNMTLTIN